MEKRHVLVTTGLGVRYPCQAIQFEAHRVAPLSSIHIVSKCQDKFKHPFESFTSLNFFRCLQHSKDFRLQLIEPDTKFFLIM